MRRLVPTIIALFIISATGWAVPCSNGSLTGFGHSAPCDISTNAYSSISSTLSSSLSGKINITPITSGPNSGGFMASIPLDSVAGLTTGNTFAFTVTAPTGFTITDLMADIVPSAGASGSGNISFALDNGSSLTSTLGGGAATTAFSGVSALGVTGTFNIAAGASGTATLTIAPSETAGTPPSAVPEPSTFMLSGSAFLLLIGGLFLRRKAWQS